MSAPPPCSQLLAPDLVAFVHGGLAAMVGTAGDDGTPALTRAFAPRVAPDARTIDIFVGRAQSTACLSNLAPGKPIATSMGSPLDYRGLQIKGTVVEVRPAGPEEAAWIAQWQALFEAAVAQVGFQPPRNRRFRCQEYVRVTFTPTAMFRQSPGPGAGNPLGADLPWT